MRTAVFLLFAACVAATSVSAVETDLLDQARAVERSLESAADAVAPAVVNIAVVRESTDPLGLGDSDAPEDWPDGLRDRLREHLDRLRDRAPHRMHGNGSGFLISPDGDILTSEHVVRAAVEIEVTLATRKRYPARIVGMDPRRDLAVIRIDAKDLPAARLGDAGALRRGQFVLALGSPFGFGRDGQASLSFGVVSGTRRHIPGIGRELDRYYGNLIQTDAAVNPGNSGGPLVNLGGEVVGVNAVISTRDGTSQGVGFAVPVTSVTKGIIARLRRGEEIEYGFLGIEMQEVTPEQAEPTGAEVGVGAYVTRVLPETPAEAAGLKAGDVVLEVGREPIEDPDELVQIVQATPVGETLRVTVLRDGKRRNLRVQTARRPKPQELLVRMDENPGAWWRGMRVEPLSDARREAIGLEPSQSGVFVGEVRDGSAAAVGGVVAGMVVDQVGPCKVGSVREFLLAAEAREEATFVHVVGQGVRVIGAEAAPPEPED